jgi:hypothetical protein
MYILYSFYRGGQLHTRTKFLSQALRISIRCVLFFTLLVIVFKLRNIINIIARLRIVSVGIGDVCQAIRECALYRCKI